jgi:hypothetical protein
MKTLYKQINSQTLMLRILFAAALLIPSLADATSYTWTGAVSSAWGNASNWSPSTGTPDFGDDVTIQTGTNAPTFEEIAGLNNFTINSGSLNLNGFTLTISGSANFNGGSINNGAISCSGTVLFAGTTFSVNVTTNSASVSFNGSIFNNPVSITKSGSGSVTSSGGNSFNNTFSLTNTGSGEIILANLNPDSYKQNVSFTNSGTGWISVAHVATGNSFEGNITFTSTGTSPGIRLGQGGGSSTLASTKLLQIGAGFEVGDLFLRNFTQSGITAQTLTLTGTASLSIKAGTTFNGNVTFNAPELFLDGGTFNGTADFTKSGSGNNQSLGGNVFNGVSTFNNVGNGEMLLGFSNPDDFNAAVTFSQSGSQMIYVAHGAAGTDFAQDITVNSTGSSKGVRFGQSGGSASLANGKVILIGSEGFTAGSLRLRNFTQIGTTAQTIELTSGTAAVYLESGTTFNAPVDYSFPQIFLNGATFNNSLSIEKSGATSNTGIGGNTFNSNVTLINSGSAGLTLGSTTADIFSGDLTINSLGSSFIQLAHGGSGHQFNGNVILNSTPSSTGIRFGQGNGTATLANTKTISIGIDGFSSGDLTIRGLTQSGATAQSLVDFSGTVNLQLETGTIFNGAVTFTAPGVILNGATFNSAAIITKSGNFSSTCDGGNTFASDATLASTGSGEWILGGSEADIFNGNLTLNNFGSDIIYVADGGSGHQFNGNVNLNSTGSSRGIRFGQNSGTSTLADTKSLRIGTSGFTVGGLRIAGLTQVGTTSQVLDTFGSNAELHLESGNIFNGNVDLNCPGIYLNGTTFNGTVDIIKSGSSPNASSGGNVFNGVTSIAVTGTGVMTMAGSMSDDFNEDVSFRQTNAFTLFPAHNVNCTFAKSISTTGSSTAISLAASNGRVTFDGTTNQSISGDASAVPDFGNMTVNKASNRVTLMVPITVSNNLTFSSGNILSSSTNLVTVLDNATVSGASSSSHVQGPVKKEGNDAFTFPIGKSGVYRPIGISAPSTIGSAFTGTFFFADSDGSYPHSSKDASLDHLSHCEYWTLDRNAGTSAAVVTLSWNTTSCGVTNLSDLRVARWDGSAWRDHGNGGTSGNTVAGSLTSSGSISSFSPFSLSSSTSENPLPITLIDFSATNVNDEVLVNWSTASETNNDYFVVEASADAVNFSEVGRVKGAGNSNAILNYSLTDEQPLQGISYYRLKQVDFNGAYTYSDVQVVNRPTLWQNEVVVSPNPVTDAANLLIDPLVYANPTIELRDIQGRVVKSFGKVEVRSFEQTKLNMQDVHAGLYFVYVQENGRVVTSRIIRN